MTDAAERATQRSNENVYPRHRDLPEATTMDEFRALNIEWRKRELEIRRDFADDLAKENGLGSLPATAKKVFDFAWQEGHADGFQRVSAVYDEISDIALVAAREGRG